MIEAWLYTFADSPLLRLAQSMSLCHLKQMQAIGRVQKPSGQPPHAHLRLLKAAEERPWLKAEGPSVVGSAAKVGCAEEAALFIPLSFAFAQYLRSTDIFCAAGQGCLNYLMVADC